MSEAKSSVKVGRPSRTLAEEIEAAERRLQSLRERQREEQRRDLERNQKAILALIRTEGLDGVPADRWKAAVPKLRKLLEAEGHQTAVPSERPKAAETHAEPVAAAG